jgi:hypothetical protein
MEFVVFLFEELAQGLCSSPLRLTVCVSEAFSRDLCSVFCGITLWLAGGGKL